MKITQEELQRRLNSSSNLVNKISRNNLSSSNSQLKHEQRDNERDKINEISNKRGNDENNRNNAGRKEDIPNAPPSLRLVAGILSHAENNSASVARGLNLTPGQVRYASDATASGETLTEKKVQEIALNRLMDALGLLSLDRIENETPKTVSTIAANLSRIHSNLKPKESGNSNNMNVILYSPKVKNESDFECIEVQSA
jgi:hypothetical protein